MYSPDFWCIVKIDGPDPHYRVFGSWSGSYTSGSSWRMNSGIVRVELEGDLYLFYGSSGSIYSCHKEMYGCHYSSQGTLNQYLDHKFNGDGSITLMPENTNWLEMDWIIS